MLTEKEKEAMSVSAKLFNLMSAITGNDISRKGDIDEMVMHIHALQNMLLAQAAARVYPTEYRLLGELCTNG